MIFGDGHALKAAGGFGAADLADDVIYLGANLRNAGQGIAVIHGWFPVTGTEHDNTDRPVGQRTIDASPAEDFRMQTLDMYVPGSDCGFWLAAVRDRGDPAWEPFAKAIADDQSITVDVMYGDYEGGQRTVTRFVLRPAQTGRLVTAIRHWNIDRDDPR